MKPLFFLLNKKGQDGKILFLDFFIYSEEDKERRGILKYGLQTN
jgi:hypothetical protein